jgi:GT2 family glycosyltransferase
MPAAAVIVITYNRLPWLRQALASLEAQDAAPDRVYVVDGPSTDGTREFLEEWRRKGPGRVVLLDEGLRGIAAARNIGLRACTEEVVAFLDDDAIASPGWLRTLRAAFRDPAVGLAGGPVLDTQTGLLAFHHGAVSKSGRAYSVRKGPPHGRTLFPYAMGCNMAWRRGVLEEIGLFDEQYLYGHDETDVAVRAQALGHRFAEVAAASVRHASAEGHNRASKLMKDWGRMAFSGTYFSRKNFGRARGLQSASLHFLGLSKNVVRASLRRQLPVRKVAPSVWGIVRQLRAGLRKGKGAAGLAGASSPGPAQGPP